MKGIKTMKKKTRKVFVVIETKQNGSIYPFAIFYKKSDAELCVERYNKKYPDTAITPPRIPNTASPNVNVRVRFLNPPQVLIIIPPVIIPRNPTTSTAVKYQ